MPLIVEDGTGIINADSYVSASEFGTYADDNGLSYADFSDDEIEQAIRRGTRYIDGNYASRWPGSKTYGRDQRLAWPRENVLDSDGSEIPDNEIPWDLKAATIEASHRELIEPGGLVPDAGGAPVTSETVGPISVSYASPQNQNGGRPTRPVIDDLLYSLLLPSSEGRVGYATFLRA